MLERPWLWTWRRRRRRRRSRLAGSCSSNLRLDFHLRMEEVFVHGTSLRFSVMSFDSDQGEIRVETDIGWEESCVDFRGKNLSETEEFHSGEMESQVLES